MSKDNLASDANVLDSVADIADYAASLDHENQAKIESDAFVLRSWATWLRTLAENEAE